MITHLGYFDDATTYIVGKNKKIIPIFVTVSREDVTNVTLKIDFQMTAMIVVR